MIVGIGYPSHAQGFRASYAPRSFDLTPTEDQAWVNETAQKDRESGLPITEKTGGANFFLRFIRDELFPLIEAEYNVQKDDRALWGHSFGGLFGLYVLFNSDGLFHRFIISSPSLSWDDRVTFKYEAQYNSRHRTLPARAFLSVGLKEEQKGDAESEKEAAVSDLRNFVEILQRRGYEGLNIETRYFADETHLSVIPSAISSGLRSVYRK